MEKYEHTAFINLGSRKNKNASDLTKHALLSYIKVYLFMKRNYSYGLWGGGRRVRGGNATEWIYPV